MDKEDKDLDMLFLKRELDHSNVMLALGLIFSFFLGMQIGRVILMRDDWGLILAIAFLFVVAYSVIQIQRNNKRIIEVIGE